MSGGMLVHIITIPGKIRMNQYVKVFYCNVFRSRGTNSLVSLSNILRMTS